jgi:hypothetical protein
MASRLTARHPDMGGCLSCPPKPRRVPERIIQAQVLHALRSVGGIAYALGTTRPKGDRPGTMQTRGWPDVGCFLPPSPADGLRRWVWVEVKARGGRLRPEQATFQGLCQVTGVDHVVGGLDQVLAYLQHHGYIRETAHYRTARPA